MARKNRSLEATIALWIAAEDKKQATYQQLHRYYHGCEDQKAKHIHKLLVNSRRESAEMESERKK